MRFWWPNLRRPCGVQAFVNRLHLQGQKWVPILDPGIHIAKNYAAHEEGDAMDIWIKDIAGRPYVGQVGTGAWVGAISIPNLDSCRGHHSPQGKSCSGGAWVQTYTRRQKPFCVTDASLFQNQTRVCLVRGKNSEACSLLEGERHAMESHGRHCVLFSSFTTAQQQG